MMVVQCSHNKSIEYQKHIKITQVVENLKQRYEKSYQEERSKDRKNIKKKPSDGYLAASK